MQTFHQARISQSAKLVEDEVWNPVPVSREMQHIANIIVESVMKDSPELTVNPDEQKGHNDSESAKDTSTSPSKHLKIDDRPYYAVSATLEVLRLVLDYLKVVVNLNMLTTETMSRVIEFLKAFNSRTCQVVLGAGAMRSAGLKNITAKHLGKVAFSVPQNYTAN